MGAYPGVNPNLWFLGLRAIRVSSISSMNKSGKKPHTQKLRKPASKIIEAAKETGDSKQITTSVSNPMPTKETKTKTQCKPSETPWWKVMLDCVAVGVGVYAALFIYKGQWDASLTANKIAAANFIAGQRPWLGVIDPEDVEHETFFDPIEPNAFYRFHYRFRNYGNSPALHIRQRGTTWVEINPANKVNWDKVTDKIDNLTLVEGIEMTTFGGASSPAAPGTSLAILDNRTVEQINALNYTVILGGRIEYMDSFAGSAAHNTTWCVVYVPPILGKYPGWRSCPIKTKAD
jgi:hypothetical protein